MNKDKARELRKNPTEAEKALWRFLRLRQMDGCKFRRQFPIGRYIVDFISFEKRIIIEVDGGYHAAQVDYDAARDEWLRAQGFRVLRFWNNQILQEMDSVGESILREINSVPPPQSSLEVGEEDFPTQSSPVKGQEVPSPPAREG